MKSRHQLGSILMLLPLLLFFSPDVYTQAAKDPQRDLTVSFSSKRESTEAGYVFGKITNRSINRYPCVRLEFNLSTRFDLLPPGEKSRHLGVFSVEVQNVTPRSVREYQQPLPYPAGIGFKSISECQGQPTEETPTAPVVEATPATPAAEATAVRPDIISFTVIPTRIHSGQRTTLRWTLKWSTANAARVVVGERNPEFPQTSSEPIRAPRNVEPSGSWQVNPAQTTVYRLGAINGAESVYKSVTVEVSGRVAVESIVVGEGADGHWRLRSESKAADEPVRSDGTRYRFITFGSQLSRNSRVVYGLHLIPLARGGENLQVMSKRRGGVVLNEPVAIMIWSTGDYIIHKKGSGLSFDFLTWDPSRQPPVPEPVGIYQWVFKSPPGASTRDHRTRNIVTQEPLGLFNTEVGAYLVYDSRAKTLRWLKP